MMTAKGDAMGQDLDTLKRQNQQRLMESPDYHPTVRDGSPLPMVRCPYTGQAQRGATWMSMTEKLAGRARTMCPQCSTDAESEAINNARVSRS